MTFELPEIFVSEPFAWGPPRREMKSDGLPVRLFRKTDAMEPSAWLATMAEAPRGVGQFRTVQDESRLKALRNIHAKERPRGPEGWFVKRFPNARNNNFVNKPKRNPTLIPDTLEMATDVCIIAEFAQAELAKMQGMQDIPAVTDIALCNRPHVYDNNMDKATSKTPIRLDAEKLTNQEFVRPDTLTDETLRDILKKEPTGTHPIVVTTDEVLALIMTCSRSVHPWHLAIFRFNRMVFISKTKESNVEMQWVGETADAMRCPIENDPIESERITSLAAESTRAGNAFVAQACTKTRYQMQCGKNPFPKTHPRLYRYRRYVMHKDSEDRYDLIVRCEVDAVQGDKYLRLFGLLEQCTEGTESEWRKTLDSQAAKWIFDEYRKNAQKMARWVSLCYLSGALMKIGFLSRCRRANGTLDPARHEVLATQTKDPGPLAAQFGVKVSNMWAIADAIIMAFLKQQEFKDAVLVKKSSEKSIMLVEKRGDDDDDDDDEEGDDASDDYASDEEL